MWIKEQLAVSFILIFGNKLSLFNFLVEKIQTAWGDDGKINKNISIAANTRFDPSKPTKFIAHGNGGELHSQTIPLAKAYSKAGFDNNIIGIEWSCKSNKKDWRKCFDEAGYNGYCSGILLEHLVNKYDLNLKDVRAIGFSYGTHVIGENIVFKHFVLDCQNIKFYRKEAALTMLPRKL